MGGSVEWGGRPGVARKYEVPPLGGPRGPGVRTVREMVGDKGPAPSRGRVEGGVGAMAARRTGVFGRQGMLVILARAASGHWEQVRVEQQIAWAERSREELWLWKGDRGGWRWRTEEGREGMSSVPRPGSDTCLSPGCHNNSPTGLPAQVPSSRPGPSGSGRTPGVSLPPLSHAPCSTQRFHRRLTLPVSWWEAEHPARPLPPPWGWRASLSSCPAASPPHGGTPFLSSALTCSLRNRGYLAIVPIRAAVFVSWGPLTNCQAGGLTTGVHSLPVLETRSPRPGVCRAGSFWAVRSSCPSLFLASWAGLATSSSLACGLWLLISAPVVTRPSPCVRVCV